MKFGSTKLVRLIRGVSPLFFVPIFALCLAWVSAFSLPTLSAAPALLKDDKLQPLPPALLKATPESVEDLKTIQKQVKEVLKKVVPATVGLRIGPAAGSGIIISEDGFVLTAGHVSGAPDRDATIILPDGRQLKGKTLGANRGIDSGLIKITDKGKYPFVPVAESSKLKVGQWCVAVGHPGGFKKGRTPVVRLGKILSSRESVIQTDCALVGGDSGGPLFDLHGRVIGIHSRIGLTLNQNFHVPADTYRDTWDRLAKGEVWGGFGGLFGGGRRPDNGYLGVIRDDKAENCRVSEIVNNSPAAKAGMKEGDVITKVDDQQVKTFDNLREYLQKKKPNDEVTLEIVRGTEQLNLKVRLTTYPKE